MFLKDSLGRREEGQRHPPVQLATQCFVTASKLPGGPYTYEFHSLSVFI